MMRHAFRRVPQSQWKDLVQQNSYAAHLGATISNVQASPPEKTEEPFTMAYDYTLKDFAEGEKHRFAVPLPPMGLPEVKDEDLKRKTPLWIGFAGERQYESRVELPKGLVCRTAASPKLERELRRVPGELRSSRRRAYNKAAHAAQSERGDT